MLAGRGRGEQVVDGPRSVGRSIGHAADVDVEDELKRGCEDEEEEKEQNLGGISGISFSDLPFFL